MNIVIRKLTPELIEDYVQFFDRTPHATNKEEHKCYCVWWCKDDQRNKEEYLASSPKARREYAIKYINNDSIQGYLAYFDNKVVGWCNANTKKDCLNCFCWRHFMDFVRTDECISKVKVKSIFCFAIAPEMRRKGIAKQLLERVCYDATQDGFDCVEVYPFREFVAEAEDFVGPSEMYKKDGFIIHYEAGKKIVMRKWLKNNI